VNLCAFVFRKYHTLCTFVPLCLKTSNLVNLYSFEIKINLFKIFLFPLHFKFKNYYLLKKTIMQLTKTYLDQLTYKINGACIEVHKILGPGLLESVYHKCLKQEFTLRGIKFSSEMTIPINYKGLILESEFRCDFLVEDSIILELKAVEFMHPIFQTKLMTYMNLAEMPKGILINFNVTHLMSEGQQTFVNELFRHLPH
jgi:GxxExxY protein